MPCSETYYLWLYVIAKKKNNHAAWRRQRAARSGTSVQKKGVNATKF